MHKSTHLRGAACAFLTGCLLLTGLPARAQQQILVNSSSELNKPNRPLNLTRAITNLINGTATMEGIISSVGANYFVLMTYNKFNLVYFTPSTTTLQLFPGAHIVATVLPTSSGMNNQYTLTQINSYDGADPTQGIASPNPPSAPSAIPQIPVYETTTLPGPVPVPIPAIPGITQ